MATLCSYSHIGVKDQVADSIANLGVKLVKELPFSKSIGKKKVKNQKHEWQMDFDERPGENAYPEDIDFSDISDAYTPTIMVTNYAQKFMVAVKVTGEAQAQAYWAGGDQMNYQAEKKARKMLRDLEYAYLNNGKAVPPATDPVTGKSTPAKLGGVRSMISSTDGGETIRPDPLTGAITFKRVASSRPTSQDILDMMEELWKAGADIEIMMVSASMKDVISDIQEETPNRLRVFENAKEVVFEVTTITDALGNTVKVVYNRLMPADCVFFYNSSDWKEAVFRAPHKELAPKSGDYIKAILSQTLGLEHRNSWCSGWLQGGLEVTGGTVIFMGDPTATVGEPVNITVTATTEPEDDGSVHYEWLLTGDSDGLTLVWDRNVATIGGSPALAGACTVTCTANGVALTSGDIAITEV